MSSRATNVVRLWLWCLGLFAATLWLDTRFNNFPYYYHTDEPGKVEQVMGKRPLNFHHPMLLLDAVNLVASHAGDEQHVVEKGRLVSALFTAGAVVAFSLMAYAWRGWLMAVGTGLALLLHHQLFELAHYFKEDTALLFGVAVTFLGLHWFARRPGLRTAAVVGLGCGLAISAKYAGAVVLLPALPVLVARREHGPRGGILLAVLVVMVATFAAVNASFFAHWSLVQESFSREARLAAHGQGGVTQSIPHTRYWSIFLANTTPAIWLLLLAALWGAWRRRRELTPVEWSTLAFPFFFGLLLSFFPKENDRYFLPATALFTVLAASGAGEIYRFFPAAIRQYERRCELGAIVLLVVGQFPSYTDDRGGLLRYWSAFQHDDTSELIAWMRANLPPGSVVVRDEKVRIPDSAWNNPARPCPFKFLAEKKTPDCAGDYAKKTGAVDELVQMGVSYVVVTDSTFGRYVGRSDLKPKASEAEEFERRKQFYSVLRREYVALKDWPRGTVIYLHPGLEIYRIAQ